jgi:hypothetical protein
MTLAFLLLQRCCRFRLVGLVGLVAVQGNVPYPPYVPHPPESENIAPPAFVYLASASAPR